MGKIQDQIKIEEDLIYDSSKIFDSLFSCIPEKIDILPSEWAEQNRFLPAEVTSRPGKFTYNHSPFWREVVDNFSPFSPVREFTVMKPSQIGYTQCVIENAMGYMIDVNPSSALYVSADKDLAEKNMASRIDAMLATSDLTHKIKASYQVNKANKTGNTKSRKEFLGGFIQAYGAKSADKFRQEGYKIVFADEVAAYETDVKGQGSPIDLIRKRTDAFSTVRKICWGGSPLVYGSCHSEALFLLGDQRRYYVPCPHCGEMQLLIWGGKESEGIKFEQNEEGGLIAGSVYYQCKNGCKIYEKDKYKMNLKGEWRPTATAKIENFRSYHINALYSNFFSWELAVIDWIGCGNNKAKLQVFVNNVLAETWKEEEKKIEYKEVSKNIRSYKPCTVPNKIAELDGNGKILLLTAAIDVNGRQHESEGWLAFEVKGHCQEGQTYSIAKAEIRGNTDPGGNAWLCVKDIIENYIFISDDDIKYKINVCGVDRGFKPESVEWFTNVCARAISIQGTNTKNPDYTFKMKDAKKGARYTLNTVYYKNIIADNAKKLWAGQPFAQPYGFINFPDEKYLGGFESKEIAEKFGVSITGAGWNDDYFKCYGSEKPIIEKLHPEDEHGKTVAWQKRNSRSATHFWDTTVYNNAVRDIYLSEISIKEFQRPKADIVFALAVLKGWIDKYKKQWGLGS